MFSPTLVLTWTESGTPTTSILEMSTQAELEGVEQDAVWRVLVQQCLKLAFLDRSVGLFEIKSSIDPCLKRFHIGRGIALCSVDESKTWFHFVQSCSRDLTARISECNEFEFGWLWIVALDSFDQARISSNIRLYDSSRWFYDTVQTAEEIIVALSDFTVLKWINPSQPLDLIRARLAEIAEQAGWML